MELPGGGLIYLYCLTGEMPKLTGIEDLAGGAYFIFYFHLYAVVSRVCADEFSGENLKRNLSDLEWLKSKAYTHEKVIEAVMRTSRVIPFKFGTLFNTEDNLKEMLKKNIKEFRDTLDYLDEKEEWGIKIYCDMDKLEETVIRMDKKLHNMDIEISSALPGRAFILKKKKEELTNSVVTEKLNEYGKFIFERLSRHSVESRINKLLPKEVTDKKEEMILNAAFLIDKTQKKDFMRAETGLEEAFGEMGLLLDRTGPWPPYNFCSIANE